MNFISNFIAQITNLLNSEAFQNLLSIVATKNFLIGAVVTFLFIWFMRQIKQAKYKKGRVTDYDNQVRFVKRARLQSKPLMNKSEYEVFCVLEDRFHDTKRFRVFAQVNLGEFIKAEYDDAARRSFNSKRTDFLIIDQFGNPKIAIEYQGLGHYGNHSQKRDEVKRLCYQSAGIHFIEIIGTALAKNYSQVLIPEVDKLLYETTAKHVIV